MPADGGRRDGSAMGECDWGLGRFAHWPVPVLFVPGNHEYDALDVDEMESWCERATAQITASTPDGG